MHWKVSDLDKVRDHLVETIYYSNNPDEEGLLPNHKYEVEKILKKQYEKHNTFLYFLKYQSMIY